MMSLSDKVAFSQRNVENKKCTMCTDDLEQFEDRISAMATDALMIEFVLLSFS